MESEVLNLENRGNCLFCKVPPAEFNPVTFYSVRTLLQYLKMNQVKNQTITVDLEGSEVNAGLCKGCGDLVKGFLEAKQMMESCLVGIQAKMEVGSNDGMEYPYLERIIMKMALEILKRKQPRICLQNMQVPETSSEQADPVEAVRIEESGNEAEMTTLYSDAVPIISEIIKIEYPVPPDKCHDKEGEADGKNTRRQKLLANLAKAREQLRQKRATRVGLRKDARQVSEAPASKENEEDKVMTIQDSNSVPAIPENVEMDGPSSVAPESEGHSKKFEGSECEKILPTNQALQQHLVTHVGKQLLTCDICGKEFQDKSKLKRHQLVHSNAKQFTCDFCQKSFNLNIALNIHERIHTEEMDEMEAYFKCPYCDEEFLDGDLLIAHLPLHADIIPDD